MQGTNGDRRRDVIATVFGGVINRMISGYLLRDVINLVDGIHFDSSDEIHTLGHLYESMLREMRDAAGDSGEFYTPRPVVQFMVAALDPRLGETVLDPACGTGGFLVETFTHMQKQCKTVKHRTTLQEKSIFGAEAKPLPYMLAQMNLLLHGLQSPNITYANSLAVRLTELGDKDRVDVILTNPPFGGEEEPGIRSNFPADKRTSETALLFLQLIMRKLRRLGRGSESGGRAAVVVPNGVLADTGIASRIRKELVRDFNLHTIVRLPNGVFSPYTPIPTNLLFLDRSKPTGTVWFYEVPLPEGIREYTKTRPLRFEHLKLLIDWWDSRVENEHAWSVDTTCLLRADHVDLDMRNPRKTTPWGSTSPNELLASLQDLANVGISSLAEMDLLLTGLRTFVQAGLSERCDRRRLGDVIEECRDSCTVDASMEYPNFGIYSFGRGTFCKPPIDGLETSAKTLYRVKAGQFIYSRLFAFERAFALVPDDFHGWFVSNEYPTFDCKLQIIHPEYLLAYFRSPPVWTELRSLSKGLGHRRQRVQPKRLLEYVIPVPPMDMQVRVAQFQRLVDQLRKVYQTSLSALGHLGPATVGELQEEGQCNVPE